MQIEPYYQVHPALADHIAYYYFLQTDEHFTSRYYAFPNINTSLNIHRMASCSIAKDGITVAHDPRRPYSTIVQGKRKLPYHVLLQGALDKITIIFKPLGLSHFIRRDLAAVAPGHSQYFSEWDDLAAYPLFLAAFYATADRAARIRLLENFLLSVYQPSQELHTIQRAIHYLTDAGSPPPITYIAQQLGLSDRAFERLFKRHTGLPPASFRKVARFRQSLEDKMTRQAFDNLTRIGYQNNFYDQSYFIKTFHQFTTMPPSRFFSSVAPMAAGKLLFRFED